MFATIKSATAKPDHTVEITWGDGARSVVDFTSTIGKGGLFARLGDTDFLVNEMKIGGDGDWLGWPDDLDFSADSLWYRSHPDQEIPEISATG